CKAYAKVTKPHLKKLDDRSKELIYLETEPESKAYRLFDLVTKDMIVSRYVKFKEDEGWDWKVWVLRIKTILRANGLWEIIEPEDNAQLDIKKDMTTTAYLYQALPEDMILQVASCNSAKEI
ncbi:zinc finger, CCHC-type containing protein, partial [Tanacetum coccineum]